MAGEEEAGNSVALFGIDEEWLLPPPRVGTSRRGLATGGEQEMDYWPTCHDCLNFGSTAGSRPCCFARLLAVPSTDSSSAITCRSSSPMRSSAISVSESRAVADVSGSPDDPEGERSAWEDDEDSVGDFVSHRTGGADSDSLVRKRFC